MTRAIDLLDAVATADRSLATDLSGEDDYSLTAEITLGGKAILLVGGGKNDTVFASLWIHSL